MTLARSARIEVRVTDAEKVAWSEAAGGARKVSEWLRSLANAAAHTGARPLDAVGEVGKAKVSIKPGNGAKPLCPRAHFHRAGTYCGSCQKIQ